MSYAQFDKQGTPGRPGPGKVKAYVDITDGVFKYIDENGNIIEAKTGPQGPQGPQGIKGDTGAQGAVGPQGPAGPVDLAHINTDDTAYTLSDTVSYTYVAGESVTIPSIGHYVMMVNHIISPASASRDLFIKWTKKIGATETDVYIHREEFKDVSNQRVPRNYILDLGTLAAGDYDFNYYTKKEATGGTAQLLKTTFLLWRV